MHQRTLLNIINLFAAIDFWKRLPPSYAQKAALLEWHQHTTHQDPRLPSKTNCRKEIKTQQTLHYYAPFIFSNESFPSSLSPGARSCSTDPPKNLPNSRPSIPSIHHSLSSVLIHIHPRVNSHSSPSTQPVLIHQSPSIHTRNLPTPLVAPPPTSTASPSNVSLSTRCCCFVGPFS